jgi:hypothetical protein
VVLALVLAVAVHLSVSIALAGTSPDFMVRVEFNENGLLATNFMGWPAGDPPESILALHGEEDRPGAVRIARAPEGGRLKSPTGTRMLNIESGWGRYYVVFSGHRDTSHAHVTVKLARGNTGNHIRLGPVAHFQGRESCVSVVMWPGGRVTVKSTGEQDYSQNGQLKTADGEDVPGLGEYEFWTLHLKTEPGEEEGTLTVSFRAENPAGSPVDIEARRGEFQSGWWVLPDVPVPGQGLEGTAGVHAAVVGQAKSPDRGLWIDSLKVQRLAARQEAGAPDESPR